MTDDKDKPEGLGNNQAEEGPFDEEATVFAGVKPADLHPDLAGSPATGEEAAPSEAVGDLESSSPPPTEPDDPFLSEPLGTDLSEPDPLAPSALPDDPFASSPPESDPFEAAASAPEQIPDDLGDPILDGPDMASPSSAAPIIDDDFLEPAPFVESPVAPAAPPAPPPTAPPAPAPPAPAMSSGGGNHATFEPGSVLSHTYRIERFLARGGMGEVYQAQHSELGTWHAIKIILPELADNTKIIDLFRREAGVLRNVRHDAVVAYDGVFRDENGRVYLVMEFVSGASLADILKERHLTPAEVLKLKDRIAAGLGAAHESGVVHRDMSPDNIIVPEGRVEDAKIIDFGIAKVADPGQATIIGDDFAGKFSYVSPEQLGMYDGVVDARSDIYSIGLILAAASIGKSLNMGDSPLSVLEARKGIPDLSQAPAELVDILSAMLEPDPRDRPQTMQAVIELGKGTGDPLFDDPIAPSAPQQRSKSSPSRDREASPPAATVEKKKSSVGIALGLGLLVLAGAGAGGYFLFLGPKEETQVADSSSTSNSSTTGSTATNNQTTGNQTTGSTSSTSQQPTVTQTPAIQQAPVGGTATSGGSGNTSTGGTTTSAGGTSGSAGSGSVTSTTSNNTTSTGSSASSSNNSTGSTSSGGTSSGGATSMVLDNQLERELNQLGVQQAPDDQTAALPKLDSAVDPSSQKRQINEILAAVKCGSVGARFISGGGDLSLSGHVPSDLEMQILRAQLLNVQGVKTIEDTSLVSLPAPQCTVLETIPRSGIGLAPDQLANAPELGRPSQVGTLSFRAGQFLDLTLEGPNYHSYYYVDYFDGANNVVHLLPSPVAKLNKLEPKQTFHIGGTDRYTIGPPYGLDLVIAVGSSVPLFDRERPEVEKADQYLADLMRAIESAKKRAPDFVGEYSYVFVQTRP